MSQFSPLQSVPGQVPAGHIDSLFRDNPGDGTLGLPDYSPVPYTYAPLLEGANGAPQWVLDQFRRGSYAAFKGTPDGLGAVRPVGHTDSAFQVRFVCRASGIHLTSPDGSRAPQYVWGPRDLAFAIRHPGTTWWSQSSERAYVALHAKDKTIGIRITTPEAEGPWDADQADTAPIVLDPGMPDPWDGEPHDLDIAVVGNNVICTLDYKITFTFRAPRAYRHDMDGTVNTGVFSDLPTSGRYGGFDTRHDESYLYGWAALQAASADLFSWDMSPTTVQSPPAGSYTPTTLASGETWAITGTATADSSGLLLGDSSTATLSVRAPHGFISTRWGACQQEAGVVFRYEDPDNYYILTSTGTTRYTNGSPISNVTFSTPLTDGDDIVIHNFPTAYRVYANSAQVAYITSLVQGHTATSLGFFNPAGGTSQWRYIAHQPYFNRPVLPT